MISQKSKLHNRFDFEIFDTETGETEYAQAENIVLNNMWTRLCGGNSYFSHIGVGTGTGELSPSRTGLFSNLAQKGATLVETVYDTETTGHVTKSVTFSEIEAIGTWTEVGIAYGSSSSNFVTHALITDSEGNTITINKTNTKIVTVYATVFAELLPLDSPNHFYTGLGAQNRLLTFLLNSGGFSQPFCFTTLLKPDGSPAIFWQVSTPISPSWLSDTSNKRRYSPLARLSASRGNTAIRGILCGGVYGGASGSNSNLFIGLSLPDTAFPGKDFTGIAIGTGDGTETQFDFPLSFVKPASETIYVNGVPKIRGVDYTVRYGMRGADTLLVNCPQDASTGVDKRFMESGNTIEEIAVLPQPLGEEVDITSIVMKNSTLDNYRISSYDIKLSLDGENWVDAGSSSSWYTSNVATLDAFTPDKYKYIKVTFKPYWTTGGNTSGVSYIQVYATPPATKHIVFATPPAPAATITADFSVEYIPKSENFVLDVQAEVIFGEEA